MPSIKPQASAQKPSFTTPRRSFEIDFSSDPDQSSPINADSEDTPDQPARRDLVNSSRAMVQFAGNKSEKKAPSAGLFDKYMSSGRGEIARKPYTDAITRRVEKRRRRNADRDVRLAPRRSSNDSDSEEQPSSSDWQQQKAAPVQPMGFIPSVLTFIDAHPSLPNTLSFYIQLMLNCFFAFCFMYVLYCMFSTIRNDLDERAMMESSEILAEMAVCAHEYKENRCERHSRVPAMETVCNSWEKCMQRDPYKVGRSRLSASMFAEIFNSFIEPISWKAMVCIYVLFRRMSQISIAMNKKLIESPQLFSLMVIVGCFAVNNLTFGLWRARAHHPSPPQHAPYMHHAPPQQTGYPHVNEHFYTPYQTQMGMHNIGQGNFGLDQQSPTKRLGYR